MINTGLKIFGQKIMIESTGIPEVDKALKTVFHDDYRKTAPLDMFREDVQIVLAWSRSEEVEPEPEQQMVLFNL